MIAIPLRLDKKITKAISSTKGIPNKNQPPHMRSRDKLTIINLSISINYKSKERREGSLKGRPSHLSLIHI